MTAFSHQNGNFQYGYFEISLKMYWVIVYYDPAFQMKYLII